MNELELLGTAIVVVLVIVAAVWSLVLSPSGPLRSKWKQQLHELEVKTRMDTGADLVDDLRRMSHVCKRLGKRWDAEQALRRAVIIARQQWGEGSQEFIAVLEEQASLLDTMHRKSEALNIRKQVKALRKGSK